MDDGACNELFSCTYSDKAHAITVTVFDPSLFLRLKSALSSIYVFQPNKNQNGIETVISENNSKSVVTLYHNNKTIFIQGKGCKVWKESVLDGIMDNESHNDHPETPQPTHPSPKQSSSRSPLMLINRLVNSLRSPSKRSPFKSNVKSSHQVTSESTSNTTVNIDTLSANSLLSQDDSFQCCDSPTLHPEADTSNSSTQYLPSEFQDHLKKTQDVPPKPTNMDETNVKQVVGEDLSMKELQKSINLLKSKLNEQSNKTGKLERELERVKTSLQSQTEINNSLASEVNHLKKELSSCTAKCLILEEQKSKLKTTIDKLSKEKSELVTQMIKNQNTMANTDSQIQTITDCMEIKLQAEMSSLKQSLLQELSEIKMVMENKKVAEPAQKKPSSSTSTNLPEQTNKKSKSISSFDKTNTPSQESKPMSVFIAGDSITKRLSPSKMSDANISVRIRSHSGAQINTIHNNLKDTKRGEQEQVKKSDVFVLHAGTNDVSNGESVDSIMSNVKSVINTVKSLNPKVKIVLSSVLPRKSEKVVNNIISNVNSEIKSLCEKSNYTFLDNNPFLIQDGRVDFKLFFDHVHLNTPGGKLFGTNIRKCLESLLNVQSGNDPEIISIDDSVVNQSSGFINGRSSGRRSPDNSSNNRYPNNRIPYHQHRTNRWNRNWSNQYQSAGMMYYPGPHWISNNYN